LSAGINGPEDESDAQLKVNATAKNNTPSYLLAAMLLEFKEIRT